MKNVLLLIVGAIIGALVTYWYCSVCQDLTPPEIVAPGGLISPEEASVLDRNFDSRHELISDSIVKRPDNRSSWYSLEDMRNYLNYAENEAKELGYTMDGVRVYLGAHDDVDSLVGYTTLFFIPTGHENVAQSSSTFVHTLSEGGDIPGGSGMDQGTEGDPPGANYPQ